MYFLLFLSWLEEVIAMCESHTNNIFYLLLYFLLRIIELEIKNSATMKIILYYVN